jgi:hypothetical protein
MHPGGIETNLKYQRMRESIAGYALPTPIIIVKFGSMDII